MIDIAIIINDKRINSNTVKYVFENYIFTTQYEYRLLGIYDSRNNDIIKADVYIIYGSQRELSMIENSIYIPYSNFQNQDERYLFLECMVDNNQMDNIPILDYTISNNNINIYKKGNSILFNFDIIWNIFFHISLFREYEYEKKEGDLGSYFYKLKVPKEVIMIPVVNYMFAIMDNQITKLVRCVKKRQDARQFEILMTHDIDAIKKTLLIRTKQAVFLGLNILHNIKRNNFGTMGYDFKKLLNMLFHSENYLMVDNIIIENTKVKLKTIFFLYSKKKFHLTNMRYYIFNPQYSLKEIKKSNIIQLMKEKNCQIGLHGSYESFNQYASYVAEKELLEDKVGDVTWNRNHWLKFSVNSTFDILEKAGIKYDSTIGFNDQIGFRAGLCTPYYPYDFKNQKAFNVIEYPMNIMDSTLFNYMKFNDEHALIECEIIKKLVKRFEGVLVLNWHNRMYSNEFRWNNILSELLREG